MEFTNMRIAIIEHLIFGEKFYTVTKIFQTLACAAKFWAKSRAMERKAQLFPNFYSVVQLPIICLA